MAALTMFSSHLLVLVLNCYLGAASGSFMKMSSRGAQDSVFLQSPSDPFSDGLDRDMVSQHMFKLYEKYNKENRLREGNTVRGFKASQDSAEQKTVYQLNLTSLQDSEVILSATFHFLLDQRPHQKAWFCKRFRRTSCRSLPIHSFPSISLLLHSVSSRSEISPGSPGSFLGNVTFHPHRRGVWQMKDVTQVIKEARDKGHLLVSVELDFGQQYQRQPEEALSIGNLPYLLLYANDQALAEPNSVAASLQRYDPFSEEGETSYAPQSSPLLHNSNSSPELTGRVRREATQISDPIQNNELPEVDYRPDGYRKASLWESTWHQALKPKSKSGRKEKKRKNQEGTGEEKHRGTHHKDEPLVLKEGETKPQVLHSEESPAKTSSDKDGRPQASSDGQWDERKNEGNDGKKHKGRAGGARPESPVLSFDERTMRKARRRLWGDAHHRGCSRRNLRVDFADIGWSEWIIAPKAFEAYYCAGTCGFPMAKVVRPSNHATIQSIVRAVGIVPGVPEPCCVPEKMSPLAVFYRDEARNPVLKVYPNMSVQSCSCR
ncbi:growth/differentiation factor 10 [Polymixia lowei]